MEPIAVLVMIAHIIKLYIMMLIPTIKSTIQTMIGLDLGRNGPYLNIRVSTDVMITILIRHIKDQTNHITLGCIPMACMISEF